jgi:lipoate-protein ligase B
MHGLAINVDLLSLKNFEGIVPCGLEGREVTCINRECENGNAESSFTVKNFAVYVQEALEEIFGICLVPAPTKLHTID